MPKTAKGWEKINKIVLRDHKILTFKLEAQ